MCNDGFISSGFNCIVEHPIGLDHTLSYVFLSIGIAFILLGVTFIGYQYRHGNQKPLIQ